MTAAPLVVAHPTQLLKLDFGCGESPKDGFEGVDLHGGKAKHRVDLFKFPLPWADNSVEDIHCSHFMEHIPAREVEERDINPRATLSTLQSFVGKDFLFAFVDECWRILRKDGWLHVTVPCGRSNRAFQDPTHRRFFVEETFAYFLKTWRDANVPQYPVHCNFESNVQTVIPGDVGLRSPEVQGEWIRTRWNVGVDFVAKMKCIK